MHSVRIMGLLLQAVIEGERVNMCNYLFINAFYESVGEGKGR
jgi:hypothetical protein